MYSQKQHGNNAQNKHQRVQEIEALGRFKEIYSGVQIDECGLFIDDELPYLGASPFRTVGANHLLTIKCPLIEYKKGVEEAKLQLWKTVAGQKTLNKKSAWYLEVQGELHVTKRKTTYLMIWLGPDNFQIIQLKREDQFFQEEMREKLIYFYNEVMLPELANSRKERRMNLRKYDETTEKFV